MVHRAVRGRMLSIIFSTLLLGKALSVRGSTEVKVELQMERWAARGGSVRLRCLHDVPPHLLDKVVFLRHGTKIFQYIKNRKPPYRNFTTPGAVLNVALASENSIILQNLDFAASGSYSCEVSLDTPIFTKASVEKQLTVFHPQKHSPRIDFPTRYLSSGDTLRANCTTAPSFPAAHVTWFVNGNKAEDLVSRSFRYRVPGSERNARRGLSRETDTTELPLLSLTQHSHIATKHTCSLMENQVSKLSVAEELSLQSERHAGRKARSRDLYVTVSHLKLVASGRLEIVCMSTIPEFRSIEDRFADIKNDTVIVDVIRPSTYTQPEVNITKPEETFNYSTITRCQSTLLLSTSIISYIFA